MIFDGNSLYASALWDEKSDSPRLETGFVVKLHMNDVYIEAFTNQSFNQGANESAILDLKKLKST